MTECRGYHFERRLCDLPVVLAQQLVQLRKAFRFLKIIKLYKAVKFNFGALSPFVWIFSFLYQRFLALDHLSDVCLGVLSLCFLVCLFVVVLSFSQGFWV